MSKLSLTTMTSPPAITPLGANSTQRVCTNKAHTAMTDAFMDGRSREIYHKEPLSKVRHITTHFSSCQVGFFSDRVILGIQLTTLMTQILPLTQHSCVFGEIIHPVDNAQLPRPECD
jgi:hypothetical protein